MNWLKKPASSLLRKVVLSINIIVMLVIGQYLASFIFASIVIVDIYINHIKNSKSANKKISVDVTEAMAKKIIEDARMHRIARKNVEKNE